MKIADDQQCPSIADDIERAGDGAGRTLRSCRLFHGLGRGLFHEAFLPERCLRSTSNNTCKKQVMFHGATVPKQTEPQLAPPGAGLPKLELVIARILFGLRRITGTRAAFSTAFARERRLIRDLVRSCPPEAAGRRVLIERPRGLEDSSRNWSVWMTLEHLRIVHAEMARIIGSLGRGESPPGRASTAAVKPGSDLTDAVVAEYEDACDTLLAQVAAVPSLKTLTRFAHPWFGPLDAAGWHALASGHMAIHRLQIARIIQGIRRG